MVCDDKVLRSFKDTTAKLLICKSNLQSWMTKRRESEVERASNGFNNSFVKLKLGFDNPENVNLYHSLTLTVLLNYNWAWIMLFHIFR